MKSCLICPSARSEVAALAKNQPLSTVPLLGKSLLEYWIEYLAVKGAKHIQILAADRPEMVRELVGDGARWGLRIEVIEESRELLPSHARTKYPILQKADWMPEPDNMIALTQFPGVPEHSLFNSYTDWFGALSAWLPQAAGENRLGMREIQPGVWVANRARIASGVCLRAPCWIGEDVSIGARCTIGPMAVVEDRAVVEADCEISNSVVGPETFVGGWTELRQSLAFGNSLVNWNTGVAAEIEDPLLLCALREPRATGTLAALRQKLAALNKPEKVEKEELELLWNQRGIKLP